MTCYFAKRAYTNGQWQENVNIEVNESGFITSITPNSSANKAEWLSGPVIPGLPNLHSHAFQRAMAGLAEVAVDNQADSFWSWRDKMYGMMDKLTPDHLQSIAQYLYIEMLKAGYTSVAEFHYVHHDQQGHAYDDLAEMAKQVSNAATNAGIGLTIVPALYSWAGFGEQTPVHGQRRFINSTDQYLNLYQNIYDQLKSDLTQRAGICFHSLRAVTSTQIESVLTAIHDDVPIHIHIAEQQKEVEDCLAWSGLRPVEYLYTHHSVNARWCLVHATHLNQNEISQIANSKTVVGLCTTTEANLGDGFFPLPEYLEQQGRFGVGSDSHISVNVCEELRWLEYEHRLKTQRRNCLLSGRSGSSGEMLYQHALQGGAQALAQPVGNLSIGQRADWIVLDQNNPFVAASDANALFDRWLFGHTNQLVKDVMVGGKWVIKDQQHDAEISSAEKFTQTLKDLFS